AYGGAAVDYRDLAWMAGLRKADRARVAWLKHGAVAAPECLYLHWELARRYAQQGEFTAAAQSFARSLACYHHTGYGVRCEEYYALGRELLEKVPAAFSATARQDLTLDDGAARMRWLVSLFQAGEVETSVKLLSDFRYDSGTDLHPLVFAFIRQHYEALGWTWAVAWCDLCAMDEDYERAEYVYRGRPLPEGWDEPLRAALDRP
ncbi:MAG: hypothetical protein JXA14_01420, partial [Anaerolineae bacterium]|nr:hypothetical protein [Anaerolineae bacterium]